jgi:hypothetical protein
VSKPTTATGYAPEQLEQVRATCLHLASVLGDLLDDLIVVGGLVPSLLIDASDAGGEAHVGTMDLDLGLELGLLGSGRYHTLAERLRGAAFEPDRTPEGNLTRQRWRHPLSSATVDFLLPPVRDDQVGGALQSLESDLAAVVVPGLPLAFRDRERVSLQGRTLQGERLRRDVLVCGPGAFVVLKALAFRLRGENKDAYDLYYVLRHYGSAVEDVAARVSPLMDDASARHAVGHLQEDFASIDSVGPTRAAIFLGRSDDDGFKADVAGLVGRLLGSL